MGDQNRLNNPEGREVIFTEPNELLEKKVAEQAIREITGELADAKAWICIVLKNDGVGHTHVQCDNIEAPIMLKALQNAHEHIVRIMNDHGK